MQLTLIPQDAPFSAPQRAWLNGFFAGLLHMGGSSGGAAAPEAPAAQEENYPWHDPAMGLDDRLKLAEGRPVEDRLMAAMAQLDCGACGYLCRTYSRAIADGSEADLTRCVPGGPQTARTLKKIVKESPAPVAVTVNGAAASPKAQATGYDRDNPYPAPLLAVKPLNKPGSAKDTRFVALDLAGSGLTYEPGDSLGVYPQNCPDTVARIIHAMQLSGNEPVAVPGASGLVPLHEALLSYRTITAVDETLVMTLAERAADREQARALRELAANEAALSRFDLLDLLLEYPSARPRPVELIDALRPLQPRLYSIASSLKAHRDEVHLTVGVVRYELDGRPRRGVASTFFAERSEPGRRVRIFIQKSHGFRLPVDPATPIIMVGPGTGIAPFRAFLQERRVLSGPSGGGNWLFFGDQHEATDFLYKHELDRYVAEGLLTHLHTAFSRDTEQKVYVQHRMLENAAELWSWLDRGAHFYVCGDAQRMAGDVDRALHRIVAEQGGMDESAAKLYVAAMAKAGLYQRDVY